MKIDSHLHLNFKGLGLKQLISYMDRERIDQCWLLTWEETTPERIDYQHIPVQDAFEAYEKYPSRIVPMYAPDPRKPDAVESFKAWHKLGIRGCGELKVPIRWNNAILDGLLSVINDLGLPLVLHMEKSGPLFKPGTSSSFDYYLAKLLNTCRFKRLPRRLIETAGSIYAPLKEKKEQMEYLFPGYLLDFAALESRLKEYPRIKFIGHGPHFWEGISPQFNSLIGEENIVSRLLSEYDNMYADISAWSGYRALAKNRGFSREFLLQHSHKILYGTDNFFSRQGNLLESLGLSRQAYARIYAENAFELIQDGGPPVKKLPEARQGRRTAA